MTVAYATSAEFLTYSEEAEAPTGIDRMLERASEVIDDFCTAAFDLDDETDLPTDADVAAAMRDATCAQIEFWLEVGEDHDVAGMAGHQVSIGHLSIDRLPPVLAPRARRRLHDQGLLRAGVSGTPASEFFARTS